MAAPKKLQAVFYQQDSGAEPVREWLLELTQEDRRMIGSDIATVEFGWPIGMPTCKAMRGGLYEVRSSLANRIARVLFCINDGKMVLLHGFVKKSQSTAKGDLALARKRMKEI